MRADPKPSMSAANTPEGWPFDPAPLAAHLEANGLELDLDTPARRFAGGLANLNYLAVVSGGPVVVRRAPSGPLPPGAHDMAREHRVLSRLADVFAPAPRSLLLCEDPSVLGAPFQIIEFRAGRTVRGEELSALHPGEDLAAELPGLLADLMARLHAVDPEASGLGDLGRPEGFVRRNVERWSARGEELCEGRAEAALAKELSAWLSAELSTWRDGAPTILHCDLKLDNVILRGDRLATEALVDWDMATRGEPLFDLATLLSYWSEPGDPECLRALGQMPTARPGFPTRAEMADAYARASGRSLDGLHPLRVLCLLKLGVVFLQLHARWRSGAIGDDRYARFEAMGFDLMSHAREVALGRAD